MSNFNVSNQNNKIKLLCIGFILASLLVYHKIFYSVFVFGDDATFISTPEDILPHSTSNGRFIQGLFFLLVYGSKSLMALVLARIFSFFTWIISIYVLINIYLKITEERSTSTIYFLFFISIILMLNLSTSIYIGWVACFQVGVGFLLALSSGYFFILSSLHNRIRNLIISLTLLLFSLSCYQTTVTAFFIPILFLFLKEGINDKAYRSLVFFAFGLGLYYALMKLTIVVFHLPTNSRSELVSDIPGKLIFFVKEPLLSALNWVIIYSGNSLKFSILTVLVLITSILFIPFLLLKKTITETIIPFIVYLSFIVVSYLPHLIVKENWASSRTNIITYIIIGIIFGHNVFVKYSYSTKLKTGILLILTTCIVFQSYRNFNHSFVEPNVYELNQTIAEIKKTPLTESSKILIIGSNWDSFVAVKKPTVGYDEYGIPSTFIAWSRLPFFKIAMKEAGLNEKLINSVEIRVENFGYTPQEVDQGYLLFDMDKILKN